jgi:hypothetical protein
MYHLWYLFDIEHRIYDEAAARRVYVLFELLVYLLAMYH